MWSAGFRASPRRERVSPPMPRFHLPSRARLWSSKSSWAKRPYPVWIASCVLGSSRKRRWPQSDFPSIAHKPEATTRGFRRYSTPILNADTQRRCSTPILNAGAQRRYSTPVLNADTQRRCSTPVQERQKVAIHHRFASVLAGVANGVATERRQVIGDWTHGTVRRVHS